MSRFLPDPPKSRPLWQILLAPMLLMSLGLHGAVLFMPIASSDEDLIPPPDPEQDNIAIVRIPPPAAPEPAPRAAASTSPPRTQAAAPTAPPANRTAPSNPPPTANRTARTAQPSVPTIESRDIPPPPITHPTPPPPSVIEPVIPTFDAERQERFLAYAETLTVSSQQINSIWAYVRQQYAFFDPTNTSREQYNDKLAAWLIDLQADTNIPDLTNTELRDDQIVSIRRRVCMTPMPVRIGFLADAEGNKLAAPEMLRSSGYASLNQQAMDIANAYTLPTIDSEDTAVDTIAYTLDIKFEVSYGNIDCLALFPPQPAGLDLEPSQDSENP